MTDQDSKNVRLSADVHAKAKAEKDETGETWDQLVLRAIEEGDGPDLEEIRQVMREELERQD